MNGLLNLGFLGDPPMATIPSTARPTMAPVAPITGPIAPGRVVRPQAPPRIGLASRLLNALAPAPGGDIGALLGPDAVKGAQRNALLTLGSSLLASGGWSNRPITLGEALGTGIQQAQAGYQQQIGAMGQQAIAAETMRAMQAQREAQAEATRALAEQRQAGIAEAKRLAEGRPTWYRPYVTGIEALPPDQQKARLLAMSQEAMLQGDTDTAQRLTAMLSSGNLFAAPKQNELVFRSNWNGRDVAMNSTTGKVVVDYGPTQRSRSGDGDGSDTVPGVPGAIGRVNSVLTKFNTAAARAKAVIEIANKSDKEISGANTVQALFSFIQGLDDTAVRDGERSMVQSADPLVQRIGQYLTGRKWTTGQQLSPRMVRELAGIIREGLANRREAALLSTDADRAFIEYGQPNYPVNKLVPMTLPEIITRPPGAAAPAPAGPVATPPAAPAGLPATAAERRRRLAGGP